MKTYKLSHTNTPPVGNFHNVQVTDVIYIQAEQQPDWHFPLHIHKNTLEISIVLKGNGVLYIDNKVYPTKAGDLIIKNANTLHSEETDSDHPIEQIYLNLTGIRTKNLPMNCLISKQTRPILHTGSSFSFYKEIFLYALHLCEQQPGDYTAILNSLASTLLSSLSVMLPSIEDSTAKNNAFPVIREIIAYLDSHYYENISLEDLAKKFYFSTYYLSRKFKEETGYTINQYVIHRRIGEAQRMLIFENMTIQEISQKNGFSSLQHFYSTFKKHSGCTPIEFRNLYHREK